MSASPAPPDGVSERVWQYLVDTLADSHDSGCASYYMPLFQAADIAKNEGHTEDVKDLRALGGACSMMLEPRSAPAPFRPVSQFENGRSALPEDFDGDTLTTFRRIVDHTTNEELRARLADIIWLRQRDPTVARQAIESYFAAAEIDHLKYQHDRMKRLVRGAQIALQLNVTGAERQRVIDRLSKGCQGFVQAQRPQRALEVLEFMLSQELAEPASALATVGELFPNVGGINPPEVRRNVLLFKARLFDRLKDKELGKKAVFEAAETLVREADQADNAIVKSVWLERAIHLLRGVARYRSHADVVQRIEEIKQQLMELRDPVLDSMEVHEYGPFDVNELVQQAIAKVSGKEPREAMLAIARMLSRPHVDSLRQSAIDTLKNSVLGRLFEAKQLGSNGRTVGKSEAGELGAPSEPEIHSQMMQTAAFRRRLVLAGYIEPARLCLNQERYLSEEDLLWLFDSNPMVPHGHELILARGLLAGLRGDFLAAGAFLIPQVEHLLRFRLNAKRVVTTAFDREGIEDEVPLEKLIDLAEANGVVDKSVAFDLRSLLTERVGSNLRNEHAHGLIASDGYFSDANRHLWAFVLRWLCLPLLKTEDAGGDSPRSEQHE